MKPFFHLVLFAGIFLVIFGCDRDKKVTNEAVLNEMENREVKKVSEAEIYEKTLEIGKKITTKTQQTLSQNLQSSMQKDGVQGAIKYCNLKAYDLVDSLQDFFHTEIRRVTLKPRNQNDMPDSIEMSILKAYEFAALDSLPLKENVQELPGEYLLYTRPIVINNALCLVCHGKPGETLEKSSVAVIKELYPEDKATGYSMDELRGMWSIRIAKKTVLQSQ